MDEYMAELAKDIRQAGKNLKDQARSLHAEAVGLAMLADEIEMRLEPSQEQEPPEQPAVFGQGKEA